MHPLLEKLTIAIPVYNDKKYLRDTVESCLGQAGKVILYDNCSTDGTREICAEFADRHPSVTHVRHAENVGAFENFRRGLFECNTEYFSWVGSHDILGKNYTLPLLQAMEKDPAVSLAAGLIVHIGEDGRKLGQVTRSTWANKSKDASPLVRVGACVTGLRRDCSVFYGIYRAGLARQAWFDTPCLGLDRAMLARTAAAGKIIYEPAGIFYARNLDSLRDGRTDRDRRVRELSRDQGRALPKDVFTRNMTMIETVLAQTKTPEDLTLALKYIDKINRRYQSRRYYQRLRLAKIAAGLLAAFFVLTVVFRGCL